MNLQSQMKAPQKRINLNKKKVLNFMNLTLKPLLNIICSNSSFHKVAPAPVKDKVEQKPAQMELNYNKRVELRKTMVGPVKEASYYLCIAHTEIVVLQGPHIIGCESLEIAESLAKDYQSKKYQVLVIFSYPFEVSVMWDEKKKKSKKA